MIEKGVKVNINEKPGVAVITYRRSEIGFAARELL